MAQLADEYRPLYLASRQVLVSAKDESTRKTCIDAADKLLDAADPRRREDGSYILGQYRSDYRLDRHIELLKHDAAETDWKLVAQAAESLGLIGRAEAEPAVGSVAMLADGQMNGMDRGLACTNGLIAAARLGITGVLPACERVLHSDLMRGDRRQRPAACFAIGLLAGPDSPIVQELTPVLNGTMEDPLAKVEALKALGNLKVPGAQKAMESFPMRGMPQVQWMVEWATARITGAPETHIPVPAEWRPQLTLRETAAQ